MKGILAILLFILPIVLLFGIIYLLRKRKNKLLKYLLPLFSLVIFIYFYFETNNFECDGYELNCLGSLGNTFMLYASGIVFSISLIICTILDIIHSKVKKNR